MAAGIRHKFVSPKADGNDATVVRPSNWNDDHEIDSGLLVQEFGAFVTKAAGVDAGGYYAAFSLATNYAFTRFYAKVTGGTGTADVGVKINGVQVHGPVSVSTAPTSTSVSLSGAQGVDVVIGIGNIAGTVTGIVIKLEGSAA